MQLMVLTELQLQDAVGLAGTMNALFLIGAPNEFIQGKEVELSLIWYTSLSLLELYDILDFYWVGEGSCYLSLKDALLAM